MGKDTFQLFSSLPSVSEGMARVLDFHGTLIDLGYIVSRTPVEADERAIESDWSAVMNDLSASVCQYEQQQSEDHAETADRR